MKEPCVYIMANRRRGTLYIGVTSDLKKKVWEHKNDVMKGFTFIHGLKTLVWFEAWPSMEAAIRREKTIKRWRRKGKFVLVETLNPDWIDLYDGMY